MKALTSLLLVLLAFGANAQINIVPGSSQTLTCSVCDDCPVCDECEECGPTVGDCTIIDGVDVCLEWVAQDDPPPPAQCADGLDNDGDGVVDLADPGCADVSDDDESDDPPPPPAQCADGLDNDGDGDIDLADDGCTDAADDDESNDPVDPPPSSDLHTSLFDYDIDQADQTAADLRVEAIGNHSVFLTMRFSSATSSFGATITAIPTTGGGATITSPWDRNHVGGYSRLHGRQGDWSEPFYTDDLQPNTQYSVTVTQRDGSTAGPVVITTGNLQIPAVPTFGLSDATKAQLQANVPSAWLARIRAQSTTLSNVNQATYRSAAAALAAAITGDASDRSRAKAFWERGIQQRAGVATGDNHRWRNSQFMLATGILANEGVLTQAEVDQACAAVLDDISSSNNRRTFDGDTDRNLSFAKVGFVSSMMGQAYGCSGYQDNYDYYTKAVTSLLLPMARMNNQMGVAGGGVQDSTDYETGTRTYWMDIFWVLQQSAPDIVTLHTPYLVNAAHQVVHHVVPDYGSRFSYGSIENGDQAEGASTNAPMFEAKAMLAWLLKINGQDAAANHLRFNMDGYNFDGTWEYGEAMALPDQIGPGRLATTYVNYSGAAAGVYHRTSWDNSASAIYHSFGFNPYHHGHADRGHIAWHHNGEYKLRENPGYGTAARADSNHNIPPGQQSGQGAVRGRAILNSVSVEGGVLSTEVLFSDMYNSDFTRSLTFDGFTIVVRDSAGAPTQTNWIGSANVQQDGTLYTIQ